MKKIISTVLAFLLILSSITAIGFGALAATPDISTAKAVLNTPYRLTGSETTEDGMTVLKVEPTEQTAVPKIDKFFKSLSAADYKYMKFIFKTSENTLNTVFAFQGGTDKTGLAKNYSFKPVEKDKWIGAIIELDQSLVEKGLPYKQVHIWPWGDASGEALKTVGAVMYIESLGFFSTLEEAKAYNSDKYELEQLVAINQPNTSTPSKPDASTELKDNREDGEYVEPSTTVADGSPLIFSSNDFQNGNYLSDPEKNITYPVTAGDDGSIRVTFAKETSVGKMQFATTSVKGVVIDKTLYKYVKVGYKYHLTNPDGNYKMMLREGHNGTSTNHTLFDLPKGKNDVWQEQCAEVTWGTSTEPNTITLHPIREGDKVAAGDYFDIMYIGFFSTEEDAKNYTVTSAEEIVEDNKPETHTAYIKGYDDATFKPNKTMSRAEACTIVTRLLTDENTITGLTTKFTDVPDTEWYFKYVAFCESKGILKSFSGEFKPMQDITRAEFAELVFNTGLAKATDTKVTFSDVPENHAKYESITAAASAGLITGYEDGTFLPDRTITRAQVVVVINRALGRVLKRLSIPESIDLTVKFTDVTAEHWAYADIAEASNNHDIYADAAAKTFPYEIWVSAPKTGDATTAKIAEVDKLWETRKAEIINTKDELEITGTKFYLAADGDDNLNDGKNPDKPRKTLPGLYAPGDAILFKRGDTFRMHITVRSGVTYGAYGEGTKPRIIGSPMDCAKEGTWTLTETANVYEYSEAFLQDVGLVVYNDGESYANKVWKNNMTEFVPTLLTKNNTFYHNKENNKIYLRCDEGKPSEVYKNIEVSTKQNIFALGADNVRIDNLCIMYTGAHGIGGTATNTHITNCVFGFIGGSEQNSTARYGNGVEFWGPSVNCSVENCYVYQVYDAGLTFQMKGVGQTGNVASGFNNILFDRNLIEKCAYNIEYFSRDTDDNNDIIANTTISNCILRKAGVGICESAPGAGGREASIKGWDTKNQATNFVIKDNIFDRSTQYLLHIGSMAWSVEKQILTGYTPQYLPIMSGNVYIQTAKKLFAVWNGKRITGTEKGNYEMTVTTSCENTAELYLVD